MQPFAAPACICGEINARHCPVHNAASESAPSDGKGIDQ